MPSFRKHEYRLQYSKVMLWRHWWCHGQMISFDIICNLVFIYNYDVQNMDFANSRKWFPFSPLLRFSKWKRNLNVSERCHVIHRGSTDIRTPGRRVTCNLQPRVWYINHSATASRWELTSAIPAVGVFRLFHKIYWVLGAFVCSIQEPKSVCINPDSWTMGTVKSLIQDAPNPKT